MCIDCSSSLPGYTDRDDMRVVCEECYDYCEPGKYPDEEDDEDEFSKMMRELSDLDAKIEELEDRISNFPNDQRVEEDKARIKARIKKLFKIISDLRDDMGMETPDLPELP